MTTAPAPAEERSTSAALRLARLRRRFGLGGSLAALVAALVWDEEDRT